LSRTASPKTSLPTLLPTQVIKALANDSRLEILRWLKAPRSHFRPQVDGDLVEDGVCGLLIAQKLGVGQPTASEHLRVLVQAGLIRGKRIKQWTFYKRDEARIAEVKRDFRDAW
jgi:DNA-binding transcriptional ArsR family regulator